jgi:hypothetical protein
MDIPTLADPVRHLTVCIFTTQLGPTRNGSRTGGV